MPEAKLRLLNISPPELENASPLWLRGGGGLPKESLPWCKSSHWDLGTLERERASFLPWGTAGLRSGRVDRGSEMPPTRAAPSSGAGRDTEQRRQGSCFQTCSCVVTLVMRSLLWSTPAPFKGGPVLLLESRGYFETCRFGFVCFGSKLGWSGENLCMELGGPWDGRWLSLGTGDSGLALLQSPPLAEAAAGDPCPPPPCLKVCSNPLSTRKKVGEGSHPTL